MNHAIDTQMVSRQFIGRDAQLAVLKSRFAQVARSRCELVLVSGEAGIGKSRLVAEAQRQAAEQGWRVERGSCFEQDGSFPYAPIIDLLRRRLAAYAHQDIADLLGPLAPELVKLLPELSLVLPGLTPSPRLEPEAERRRLFEVLAQFFSNLIQGQAAIGPTLLILEDLHWSDDATLDFVPYLTRRLADHPLLLLLTYRSEEVHPLLHHFLARLDREQRPAELALQRFTRREVDALLRAIFDLDRPVRAEFLETLLQLTDGNPFFIEEVLKSLVAEGDLFYSDGSWDRKPIQDLRIPRSVQDAVQRRVARLSEGARRSLAVAAVIGQQFGFETWQPVTGETEETLLAQLKEMLAAQLIVESGTGKESLAFRHALTRQAVYTRLLVRERQNLHRRIGEAMEGRSPDSATRSAAGLAYHFDMAGDGERTLTYARRAATQAQDLNTPRAVIDQLSRAVRAAQQLQRIQLLPELYRERGLAYETVGEFERARADLESALRLAQEGNDHPLEWQILVDLGRLWAARDYARTGDYFRRALELARTLEDADALARSLNWLGNWQLNTEQPQEAQHSHLEALTIFQSMNDQSGLAETADLLGMAYSTGTDFSQGAVFYAQAIRYFQASGERQRLSSSASTLTMSGAALLSDNSYPANLSFEECMRWHSIALETAQEIEWGAGEAYALITSLVPLSAKGFYGHALANGKRALSVAQGIDHHQWICAAYRTLGMCYFDLFSLETCREYLQRSLTLANELGSILHIQATLSYLIRIEVLEKNLAAAEALLQTARISVLPMFTFGQRSIWLGNGEYQLAKNEPEQALEIADRLIATAPPPPSPPTPTTAAIPNLARLRGEALTALKRWDEAEEVLLVACKTAEVQDSPRLIWPSYLALGKLYLARRRRAEAENAFATARSMIQRMAATVPDQDLRENFVSQAHNRFPQPPPLTPLQIEKKVHDGLTRRQRQVAGLVAQGKSNREIAETLVLGVRTVEGHVGQILSKLGLTSRAQIAVWVVENEKLAS